MIWTKEQATVLVTGGYGKAFEAARKQLAEAIEREIG